ncbi:hypothetical protein ACHAPO_011641 [Fusarium lateritium]
MTSYASLVIRAQTIHTQVPALGLCRVVAISEDRIVAVSPKPHGLDGYIGPNTVVLDEPNSTVLPSFDDTHTHLMFAAMSQFDVPVHLAKNIPSMLDMLCQRAASTPIGEWIMTTANWQEFNLEEQRFPTRQELDNVSTQHPIIVKRGGHNIVANSVALDLAGITDKTVSPEGGVIGRDNDGNLNGLLQDNALTPLFAILPQPSFEESVRGIESASKSYAATGIGCVRDCAVFANQMKLLKAAHDEKRLHVRLRVLIAAIGMTTVAEIESLLDEVEQWRCLDTDPWLQVWGIKFSIDGGIEASATESPYLARPDHGCCGPTDFRGTLTWDPDTLEEAMEMVLHRGWRIGTHAFGDRAVRVLLDVYQSIMKRCPDIPSGSLVIEHGGLAHSDQRARAIRLGIPVTVQHPLLHDAAGIQSQYIGEERESHLFPVRQWIDEGADISAGSDYPVGAYGAMNSVWGLTTRQTVLGVLGPEHAISRQEAIDLHTTRAAKLTKEEQHRGRIRPGFLGDLTVWPSDPLIVQPEELLHLQPSYTIIGGTIVYKNSISQCQYAN